MLRLTPATRCAIPFALAGALLSGGARPLQDASAPAAEPDWAEILGPPRGEWPAPQEQVTWREDLNAALREARAEDRPVFVTLRCLPCKQCMSFDQAVLEGGPELDPLLARFVTVRLTTARAIDLRLLPVEGYQDLDLSWWGWLLSPDARIYAVFGGKDHVSDATRISAAALARTLERVLDHHADPRRPAWNVDGPAPVLEGEPRTPPDLPGFEAWADTKTRDVRKDQCLHCHEVAEILRQPALDAGTFDKRRDLEVWPLPENVGIVLERDHGLSVASVVEGSPAARAGIAAGDVLAAAGGRKLFGQADFRGVLHRAPRQAEIELRWLRGEELLAGTLELDGDWRKTDVTWRMSIHDGNIGAHPGFDWAHAASDKERRRHGIPAGSMAIRPWWGKQPGGAAREAGLEPSHVVIAIDGESPDVSQRPFMSWFRLRYDPGDEVTLTVLDARGRERKVTYTLKATSR